jgi:hypothetical protein
MVHDEGYAYYAAQDPVVEGTYRVM